MEDKISRRRFVASTTAAAAAAYGWKPLFAYGSTAVHQTLTSSLLPMESGHLVDAARNRLAHQSSAADDDHTAHLVTDGSGSTYWQSKPAGEQWVAIDLGEPRQVSRVTLHWGSTFATKYRLEVSTGERDPMHWATVHSMEQGRGSIEEISITPLLARQVRLVGMADEGGFAITEIEVWSARKTSVKPTPVQTLTHGGTLLDTGWTLQSTSFTANTPQQISNAAYLGPDWLPAVVPGTVLASYREHGAVPDPYFGNQQSEISEEFFTRNDFWYRNSFVISPRCQARRLWLVFEGINWKADVYLNGKELGNISGAFLRGRFDITAAAVRGGTNCVAVLVHKVAHPGEIEHKQLEGKYQNGGVLALDSPTFTASIGWNWVPTIRGRNTGIWNDVRFETTGDVVLEDPWVSSKVASPENTRADLTVRTEMTNVSDVPMSCALLVSAENISYRKEIRLKPHETRSVTIDKGDCPALSIENPQLWWPNGYGDPTLHTMDLRVEADGVLSDQRTVTFGIREMSYKEDNGILTILVNGYKILCRGGNWGMDEGMLRCDKQGYDLRVAMHRDMNMNMIRNWIGMVGKDAFYDACDRHGMLIWDDFWLANPSDGPDPTDHAMFMTNAKDKIRRVRHHPSVAIYCGRNEGVPPPDLDAGMRNAVAELDGTRYYISASASGLVTGHGPYDNQDPEWYFEHRGATFHTEQGIVCVPPLESMRAMMPEKDLWPISDMWAIHEYQNPRSVLYTERISKRYGAATGIEDYCRKAQMVNLETAKAMLECIQSRQGSGQIVWMTQAAWPALICQLYDFYFEQTGAYFGAKTACEPLHILWDQHSNEVKVANNTTKSVDQLQARASIYDLQGQEQWHKEIALSVPATSAQVCFPLVSSKPEDTVFFVRLRLSRGETLLSENFYWSAAKKGACTSLDTLPRVHLSASAHVATKGDNHAISATVTNQTSSVALAVRLKLIRSRSGDRVLPAMYEDNYFSLLPNEHKTVSVQYPLSALAGEVPRLVLSGWNIKESQVEIHS